MKVLVEWAYERIVDTLNAPPPKTDPDRDFLQRLSLVAGSFFMAMELTQANADLASKYFMLANLIGESDFIPDIINQLRPLPESYDRYKAWTVLADCANQPAQWKPEVDLSRALFIRLSEANQIPNR